MKIAILGRQPELSLAELDSLLPGKVSRLNEACALLDADQVEFPRLGGTIKLAQQHAVLDTTRWPEIGQYLQSADWLEDVLGRDAGISLYGSRQSDATLLNTGLEMKKAWAKRGLRLRILRPTGGVLSAAQITHQKAADIVVAVAGQKAYIGITENVQDIEAYGKRDFGRPGRDARVGMLPPKLAQIMINLANPSHDGLVADPFCGTGVVLQEALLMGLAVWGSDVEPRMTRLAQTNLDWLSKDRTLPEYNLSVADATSVRLPSETSAIVTEGFLGPAVLKLPAPDQLKTLQAELERLYGAFLRNMAQLATGSTLCLASPAWRTGDDFTTLGIVDLATDFGYTSKVFQSAGTGKLIYWRPGQIVGRQITVLIRN